MILQFGITISTLLTRLVVAIYSYTLFANSAFIYHFYAVLIMSFILKYSAWFRICNCQSYSISVKTTLLPLVKADSGVRKLMTFAR